MRRLREWADLRTGKGPVYSQDWSPDGRLLVTADYDQVRVWDIAARREAGVLVGHSDFVWGLAWSPDGSILASASQDRTVRLWDVAAYTETAVLDTGWAFCVDWSPDGKRLAVGNRTGNVQVWDVETRQLVADWQGATPSVVISIGWSPDGATVAAGEFDGDIVLWDVESGRASLTLAGYTSARRDVNGLAWSPDGRRLATAHQDGQVRLWDGATGELVRTIDAHRGWARGVAWSPDGGLLASTGEDKRICLWNPETGYEYAEQHHNRLPVWSAAWSPDGSKVASGGGGYEQPHVGATIVWAVPAVEPAPNVLVPASIVAFYSDRDGNPEIYTIHADGSNVARLTNDPGFDDSPALSPDGAWIAFLTARHDPSPSFPNLKYEIYVMGSDGSNPRRLTETEAAEDHLAWSPDGSQITFDADYDGDGFYEIYTMNTDGTDVTRLTSNAANDQFADWSPDGTRIAFSSDRNGNWDVFVMEADGSNQRALTGNPNWELFPAWSPDGTQIAFNGLLPHSRNSDIFVMNADGGDVRQLTDSPHFDENPAWSPDGSLIAFQTARDGNFEIYVMAPDGSNQCPLAAHRADELWPSWGPAASQGETRYLGQTPPGDEVAVFAPGVVSIKEGKEYKITMSPDAQEIFFTRRTPNGGNDRIWYARLEDGVLTTPELAPFAYDCLEMDPS